MLFLFKRLLGENGVPKVHLYFSYFCESNFATTIFAADSNVPAGWLVAVVLEVMRAAGLGGGRSSIELDVILGRGESGVHWWAKQKFTSELDRHYYKKHF